MRRTTGVVMTRQRFRQSTPTDCLPCLNGWSGSLPGCFSHARYLFAHLLICSGLRKAAPIAFSEIFRLLWRTRAKYAPARRLCIFLICRIGPSRLKIACSPSMSTADKPAAKVLALIVNFGDGAEVLVLSLRVKRHALAKHPRCQCFFGTRPAVLANFRRID